jgi:hypothetical protein
MWAVPIKSKSEVQILIRSFLDTIGRASYHDGDPDLGSIQGPSENGHRFGCVPRHQRPHYQ